MDYFSSWAPVTFDWLLAEDIAVFRAVCKDWQQFAYSKIKEWLSNLMNHKHTAPRGEKPILKYRPYLYQLYDAYRFSLIDVDTYVTCKSSGAWPTRSSCKLIVIPSAIKWRINCFRL